MDLMLFTVYHVTKIFLKKESGFSRDSSSSAELLSHTEVLGILVCYRIVQCPGNLHRAGKTQAIPHFHISSSGKQEQTSCHSLRAVADSATAGRWKIHLFVSASKIL